MKAEREVEPMQCKLVATLPEGAEWLYEIKWDGYRAIGRKNGRRYVLTSRQGKSFSKQFPAIEAALHGLRCRSCTVDGEVVAVGETGAVSFQALQNARSAETTLVYFLFDLLELDGVDLTKLSLIRRRTKLESLLPSAGPLRLSPELPPAPAALMEGAAAQGFEGIIAKLRDSKYEQGERSGAWQKWKAERSGEFVIGGYVPGGNTFAELVIGQREGRKFRYVARLKAGFVPATRREVMEAIKPHRLDACPFFNLPEPKAARWGQGLTAEEMEKCRWLCPRIKVRVAFVEWTEGMHLRHSRFLALV